MRPNTLHRSLTIKNIGDNLMTNNNMTTILKPNLSPISNLISTNFNSTEFMAKNLNTNLIKMGDINSDLIKINNDSIHIDGDFSAETITSSGDINGDNLSLIGDITVTNINLSGYIKSQVLLSDASIDLIPAANNSINVGNICYGTDVSDTGLINSFSIKTNKFFICTQDTLIESSESINGIEIIIYNNNPTTSILIRDQTSIIFNLVVHTSIRLVYISHCVKWIIV